jgi:glyoxylase-like metal-dependent hydrolase (beta-lactamase superfamily II)
MPATQSEVFPGVFRIELPLPFELASVNVHLIRLDDGFLLLDCGMDTQESFAALEQGLRDAGIAWTQIRTVLLTHTHPDHMGQARRVLELTGARLWMHPEELRQLEVVTSPERRALWIGRAFAESGVPEPLQARMQQHFGAIRRNFYPLTPERLLAAGDRVETGIGSLEVLWTPGHSPGHLCLYSEQHRLLISGDQILPTITPNIAWLPERDPLHDFLTSLAALRPLEIDLIVPSHGEPFSGHRAWIDKTSRHHYQRCDYIRETLADPKTAYTLVGELWPSSSKLSPINQQFALLEVMAHLEFMKRQGQIRNEANRGLIQWFV